MQALRPAGRVIVLNGPSISGKSTLAKYLCENLEQQHLHVELDAFRRMEPTLLNTGTSRSQRYRFAWPPCVGQFMPQLPPFPDTVRP
ncbi:MULTISPECIES: phosphotransferase-like protein [Burkholderia]|uniref:phosphotransferase-like protein n=1 Tax=Burkholderia TaxID=32008 RepID=UPI00158F2129